MYQNIDYVHLTRKDRRQLSRNIKDTLANLKSKKESATFPCIIDLTEDSIDEMFKYYDTPNEVIPAKDIDSVYLVRPPEQTLAERQTEQYRLELLMDIMEGKVSPNVHIIILTDRDFKQKLFIYDGQHQTLLLAMFKNGKLVFETSHLRKAVERKKADYGDDFNNHNSWTLIDEFLEKYTEDTFDYSALVNSVPELNENFNSQNKMKIVGQMHFMDGRSAACLMKKLNEHKSSHSTAQRVKSDLTGKPIHRLLFESELQVDDKKTYLSDIVKSIHLFNRSNNPLPKGIPPTFSYDKFSDDYTNMNYDQYLILVYQLILSKTKIYIDDSNKYCYKFDINLNADDSVLFAHGNSKFFENDVFAKYGLKDDVYESWYGIFSKLEIDDESSFVKFLENILTLAKITTDESFVNEINQFSKNINGLTKPISIEMADIELAYPIEDKRPDDIHKQYDSLKKKKSKLNEFKLDKAYNLIVFYSMILDSHLRSLFSLKDWMIGYLKTINVNTTFDTYITTNVGEITSPGQASTPKRFKLWNRYFGNRNFNDLVKSNLSGSDKSLWTRFEADEYFDKILDHDGDRLYKCPITAKWVTKSDFESHHLSFRSSETPQKEFKYWFPLSSKWNGLISDDTEKNIVADNGTFLEACDALIDHLKIKEKNSSSKKEKSDWSSSYRTIQNWKEKAEIFFEEEEAKKKKKNK